MRQEGKVRNQKGWRLSKKEDIEEKAGQDISGKVSMFNFMYWIRAFNILNPIQSLCYLILMEFQFFIYQPLFNISILSLKLVMCLTGCND